MGVVSKVLDGQNMRAVQGTVEVNEMGVAIVKDHTPCLKPERDRHTSNKRLNKTTMRMLAPDL